MRQAIIVIGSSYGDEGKGMATCQAVRRLGKPCLNILINGGPQRGHTVETPDGKRHVFHHFGAGCAVGAVSYMDADFMVNPMIFQQEREQLIRDFPEAELRCIVDPACRVTMPYDMMLNQIVEDARGVNRHGSCGLGIFETRHRFERTAWGLRWGELIQLSYSGFAGYCLRLADEYVAARLAERALTCPEEWKELLHSEGLIRHAWQDLQQMRSHTELCSGLNDAAEGFPNLVFEAGQGLALDEGYIDTNPHLTPSHTTSLISARRIKSLGEQCQTEVLYVTRTYLTRHGAGPLPTECPMEEISPDIIDQTNMPNPYQQTIRYGRFNGEEILERIRNDIAASRRVLPDLLSSVAVTHLNETGGRLFGSISLTEFTKGFDRVYLSDDPYAFRLCGSASKP